MIEIKAITYAQARTEFFRSRMERAQRQIKYWQARIRAYDNPDKNMKYLKYLERASGAGQEYNFYKDALQAIENHPNIGEAEWVEEPDRYRHWHCSCCGRTEGMIHYTMFYCPSCGKKMKGAKNEQYD